MKLYSQVGLGPDHIVLDGDRDPLPKKGAEPLIFGPCVLWPNGSTDQDGTWHGGGPRSRAHCVDGEPMPWCYLCVCVCVPLCVCVYLCVYVCMAVPEMTYNVFSGTLNPTHSHSRVYVPVPC